VQCFSLRRLAGYSALDNSEVDALRQLPDAIAVKSRSTPSSSSSGVFFSSWYDERCRDVSCPLGRLYLFLFLTAELGLTHDHLNFFLKKIVEPATVDFFFFLQLLQENWRIRSNWPYIIVQICRRKQAGNICAAS
jgi:hypothetical protein